MKEFYQILGLIAACVMPLFNIPLIARILKRKSSKDISIAWVTGVWACILLMLPSALISTDFVFRVFAILNVVLFTAVALTAYKYR